MTIQTDIAILGGGPGGYVAALRAAVQAGRQAYEAGLPISLDHAEATSPLTGFLQDS